MRATLLHVVLISTILLSGCAAGGGSTTQPSGGLDAATVALLFDTALTDYTLLAEAGVIQSNSKTAALLAAAQAALASYQAGAGTADVVRLLKAANDAVMAFVIETSKAKQSVPLKVVPSTATPGPTVKPTKATL